MLQSQYFLELKLLKRAGSVSMPDDGRAKLLLMSHVDPHASRH